MRPVRADQPIDGDVLLAGRLFQRDFGARRLVAITSAVTPCSTPTPSPWSTSARIAAVSFCGRVIRKS
jgi:hypothetical protein